MDNEEKILKKYMFLKCFYINLLHKFVGEGFELDEISKLTKPFHKFTDNLIKDIEPSKILAEEMKFLFK